MIAWRLPAHTFEAQAEDLGHCLKSIAQNSFRFQQLVHEVLLSNMLISTFFHIIISQPPTLHKNLVV